MFGKIIDGRLVIAGSKIKIENGYITNPTEEQLKELGYKTVKYTERPTYNREEEKLVERYTVQEDVIVVDYDIVALTTEEHNAIIQQEIATEENKITKRRQRDIDLNKEGARDFEQQIENNIITLRQKLRPVEANEE